MERLCSHFFSFLLRTGVLFFILAFQITAADAKSAEKNSNDRTGLSTKNVADKHSHQPSKIAKSKPLPPRAESVNLALAFSEGWTYVVKKDKPNKKEVIFFPKGQTLLNSTTQILERRVARPKHFKIAEYLTHLTNSPIESGCRPIEAGDVSSRILQWDGVKRERRYIGMRCRREKIVKVIHVFDAGPDVYVLIFSKKQDNWADQQFKAMNKFLLNRSYLCRDSKAAECNEEIQTRIKPSEFDLMSPNHHSRSIFNM